MVEVLEGFFAQFGVPRCRQSFHASGGGPNHLAAASRSFCFMHGASAVGICFARPCGGSSFRVSWIVIGETVASWPLTWSTMSRQFPMQGNYTGRAGFLLGLSCWEQLYPHSVTAGYGIKLTLKDALGVTLN